MALPGSDLWSAARNRGLGVALPRHPPSDEQMWMGSSARPALFRRNSATPSLGPHRLPHRLPPPPPRARTHCMATLSNRTLSAPHSRSMRICTPGRCVSHAARSWRNSPSTRIANPGYSNSGIDSADDLPKPAVGPQTEHTRRPSHARRPLRAAHGWGLVGEGSGLQA
ncbi:hypothetical protein BO71DRAFT_413122 [Aspergillus ellipticus CBS 707.79]|uniref:Uncharacterized protein n=1 Tax=Aspergillus ellipticus CBS 707.79 TaxID=1448320 RepID=A0A319CWV0_9EURO|nr:hypothetical protein BO71DRAFT_413122 [Aspergillus ellipticus CBS 707.79]